MSYILDALKKSDQERSRERGPTLASVHGGWQPPPRRWRTATTALALGALALLGVLVWKGYPIGSITGGDATPVKALPPVAQTPTAVPVAPAAADVATSAAAGTPATAMETPLEVPSAVPAQAPLQDLWELPDPLRASFPALTFSFHVYAETPSRRTIIINGRRQSEGDSLGPDLLLEEITQEGVILQFRDRRVRIAIINDW